MIRNLNKFYLTLAVVLVVASAVNLHITLQRRDSYQLQLDRASERYVEFHKSLAERCGIVSFQKAGETPNGAILRLPWDVTGCVAFLPHIEVVEADGLLTPYDHENDIAVVSPSFIPNDTGGY